MLIMLYTCSMEELALRTLSRRLFKMANEVKIITIAYGNIVNIMKIEKIS